MDKHMRAVRERFVFCGIPFKYPSQMTTCSNFVIWGNTAGIIPLLLFMLITGGGAIPTICLAVLPIFQIRRIMVDKNAMIIFSTSQKTDTLTFLDSPKTPERDRGTDIRWMLLHFLGLTLLPMMYIIYGYHLGIANMVSDGITWLVLLEVIAATIGACSVFETRKLKFGDTYVRQV